MNESEFFPPRGRGFPVHITLIAVLTLIAGVCGFLATREPIGLRFTIYILVAALAFSPIPILVYRLWALTRASYCLDRDSLTLTWGMRVERIPVSEVEWVRTPASLTAPLLLPTLWLPGSVLGLRRVLDLGPVEFLASETTSILLVATRHRVFAISPSDPQAFLQTVQRTIEMGSLSPAPSESVYPSFIVGEAWKSMLARWLWMAGLFVNVGLLAWVSLMIPTLGNISLGFLPSGAAGAPVPGAGLILIPVISIFLFALGWVAGLVFYRSEQHRALAHIVWASGLVTSVLFLVAVLFIVTTPV
jgi:hypothetical protein